MPVCRIDVDRYPFKQTLNLEFLNSGCLFPRYIQSGAKSNGEMAAILILLCSITEF